MVFYALITICLSQARTKSGNRHFLAVNDLLPYLSNKRYGDTGSSGTTAIVYVEAAEMFRELPCQVDSRSGTLIILSPVQHLPIDGVFGHVAGPGLTLPGSG